MSNDPDLDKYMRSVDTSPNAQPSPSPPPTNAPQMDNFDQDSDEEFRVDVSEDWRAAADEDGGTHQDHVTHIDNHGTGTQDPQTATRDFARPPTPPDAFTRIAAAESNREFERRRTLDRLGGLEPGATTHSRRTGSSSPDHTRLRRLSNGSLIYVSREEQDVERLEGATGSSNQAAPLEVLPARPFSRFVEDTAPLPSTEPAEDLYGLEESYVPTRSPRPADHTPPVPLRSRLRLDAEIMDLREQRNRDSAATRVPSRSLQDMPFPPPTARSPNAPPTPQSIRDAIASPLADQMRADMLRHVDQVGVVDSDNATPLSDDSQGLFLPPYRSSPRRVIHERNAALPPAGQSSDPQNLRLGLPREAASPSSNIAGRGAGISPGALTQRLEHVQRTRPNSPASSGASSDPNNLLLDTTATASPPFEQDPHDPYGLARGSSHHALPFRGDRRNFMEVPGQYSPRPPPEFSPTAPRFRPDLPPIDLTDIPSPSGPRAGESRNPLSLAGSTRVGSPAALSTAWSSPPAASPLLRPLRSPDPSPAQLADIHVAERNFVIATRRLQERARQMLADIPIAFPYWYEPPIPHVLSAHTERQLGPLARLAGPWPAPPLGNSMPLATQIDGHVPDLAESEPSPPELETQDPSSGSPDSPSSPMSDIALGRWMDDPPPPRPSQPASANIRFDSVQDRNDWVAAMFRCFATTIIEDIEHLERALRGLRPLRALSEGCLLRALHHGRHAQAVLQDVDDS
ncbi:hypothetical protein LTR53_003340 [Teratosphaeriaceae sp. CCFEE 6253]|nr:hypothetical protein LTR53_003340 [Teratosphaeriaceae sp. CCFEE 6253]